MSFWADFLRWLGLRPESVESPPAVRPGPEQQWAEPEAEGAPVVTLQAGDSAAAFETVPYERGTVRKQDQAEAEARLARELEVAAEPAAALPQARRFAKLDAEETLTVILEGPEEEILWSIARRIESGRLDLPTLPSTSMAVIELANNPSVEFRQLVSQISMDPVLSSELLRTANSVLYATEEPVETLHSAVVRIGLRALRSMIFSVSMRGTILRSGVLAEYAEDVWRQSYSVAMIARDIAPVVGVDPEKAFLLGLLQDIGKISLLAMLSKEVKVPADCTPALVGHVFQVYHQEAGAAMARKWKLPSEFSSVAGCHHDWMENTAHTRSAALANLSHHLDLALSLEDAQLLASLSNLPSLLYLAPQENAQARIFELAKNAHASIATRSALA
jgi:putative nucleotidyltransferase with HDIG domain